MEDRDNSRARRAAGDAERFVELTPDMEMPEDADVRIIDLTDAVDGSVAEPAETPPAPHAPDKTTAGLELTEPPAPAEKEPPEDIELAVDAAFDAVQEPIEEPAAEEMPIEADDGLIDRLSDIPRMVDEAEAAAGPQDAPAEMTAEAASIPEAPPEKNEWDMYTEPAQPGSDPDAIGAGDDEEGIVPLEDVIDPEALQTTDAQSVEDDDEIIELTDIVDPNELAPETAAQDMEDDDILELTDVVDIAELDAEAPVESDDGEEILELTDIVSTATPDADRMHADDAAAAGGASAPEKAPRQQESVIRLSEVLNHGAPKDEKPPIEQIKMGVEEDLARQDISVEAEDTANSMGLDLEQATARKGKALTDEEIEAAVERILQTKYADTIEQLIARTVEKAVSREIENLKRAMLDGEDPPT